MVGLAWWYRSPRRQVVFCDVGQGDGAIVIDGDFQMLIDTGSENGKMNECLSRHLPFWDKEIEMVIISHWDADHSGGLARLQNYYKIDKIISGYKPSEINEQINYSGNIAENDIIRAGDIEFEVKWPEINSESEINDDNKKSIMGILNYGTKKILFTGDVTTEIEQKLVWRGVLRPEDLGYGTLILKVSHHGSSEGTSEELLETVKPQMAIISVGAKNKFGHPTKEVLERLKKYGVLIKRTDQEGDIVVECE